LVSVYSAGNWIEACLKDLTQQSLFQKGELEIIIVDANSPDHEKETIRRFQLHYPGKIRYRRERKRITLYAAWNRAIRMSKGRYLTSANVDDKHAYDALEKMAEVLDHSPEIGLVYADQWITEDENDTFATHSPTSRWGWPEYDRSVLQRRCIIGPQPVWRRTLHYHYGMFDESFRSSGDWEFWLRLSQSVEMRKLNLVLGLYFRNQDGLELSNPAAMEELAMIRTRYGLEDVQTEATIPVAADSKSQG